MALELRNRLERTFHRSLPAILVFEHPSVEALAHDLASRLQSRGEPARSQAAAPAPSKSAPESRDPPVDQDLNTLDIAKLLDDELKKNDR